MNKTVENMVAVVGTIGLCEICDNYTPRVVVLQDGHQEIGCQYCWEAYGEIN